MRLIVAPTEVLFVQQIEDRRALDARKRIQTFASARADEGHKRARRGNRNRRWCRRGACAGFSAMRRSEPRSARRRSGDDIEVRGKLGPSLLWNIRSANAYCSAIAKYGRVCDGLTYA